MKYSTHKFITEIVGIAIAVLVIVGLWATSARADGDGLPDPGMEIVPGRTALVVTDPQNDFLSPDGVTWGVVGKSVRENRTIENKYS